MSKPSALPKSRPSTIRIQGARQHNLKNLNIDINTGEITVFTGVSGSGKSSLVFDTLYAEGQRRYVETFSPYARQFLDRMDKPQVDRIEGVPPAIAIDQSNPVRTSRSTVGTMTEINDHLKQLFARGARLYCRCCAQPVREDTPATISAHLQAQAKALGDPRLYITFPVAVPDNFSDEEIEQYLSAQGYTRTHGRRGAVLDVVQDRFKASSVEASRLGEALETALHRGHGKLNVFAEVEGREPVRWAYSEGLHCASCDLDFSRPLPSTFSFNSPIGACEACRGFGRVVGIDYGLVIPDESKSLEEGAIKPWQTESFKSCQADLVRFAKARGVAVDRPWRDLPKADQRWVIDGDKGFDGNWEGRYFYGVKRYFDWLETRTYKMHVRVLLSKYRSYTPCQTCRGARLKTEGLVWRLGQERNDDQGTYVRFRPTGVDWSEESLLALPGLSIHELMLLPLSRVEGFINRLTLSGELHGLDDETTGQVLAQVKARLRFLNRVGLGYLTLDRQSRTLSGGEVQRINLTTALGTSLVNTLFVLDEPSIGLHPRDMSRVITAMEHLRDAGNTLVVVEHDPQVMLAANRIVDIGPGPGEQGGQIVFDGTPNALLKADTLTAQYLSRRKTIQQAQQTATLSGEALVLKDVSANNLKHVDVRIPLGGLVLVTGVSGSGKSTLVQDVLVPALKKAKGQATEPPGAFGQLSGDALIAEIAFVDQSPIGKTTRSNPASYVGAFDSLRNLFAKTPLSKERGYTAGFFSFNSGDGRCPTCGGNGFEHVEMQFLSDVYLRCGDCNGTRYRAEALEVTIARKGQTLQMAQVLELTVEQALDLFDLDKDVVSLLQPLADVGLGYIRLGQPVPTLSGGEAQRLKLAGFLAEVATKGRKSSNSKQALSKKGTLFIFDEPTTGLHFDDVSKLMGALYALRGAGHSLLVVEHNLDVIAHADWVIDLGPEAGAQGGMIVAEGTPEHIMASEASHTGRALREYLQQQGHQLPVRGAVAEAAATYDAEDDGEPLQSQWRRTNHCVSIHHAREHNLKNISLDIPHGEMTVITGPSGSGKSTLAFDILFAEGQRRYLESLNAYARQFVQPAAKPDVDAIYGIAPTVAIEQRTSRGGRKSTVATVTEIYHFLRLLYVKLGIQHCPDCNTAIAPQSYEAIAAHILSAYKGKTITLLAPLVVARKGIYNELAKWAITRGHDRLRVDGAYLPTRPWPKIDRFKEHSIELPVGTLEINKKAEQSVRELLTKSLEHGKGTVMVVEGDPVGGELSTPVFYSTQRACPSCARSFPELDPRLFSYNSKHGWCPQCVGTGTLLDLPNDEETGEEEKFLDAAALGDEPCPACHGQRLNPVALSVLFAKQPISTVAGHTVTGARTWLEKLKLTSRESAIAQDIVQEMISRLNFLERVGLSYLSLDRAAPTLSGGEAQRIRLAAQLGTNLRGVCYVLDEPTIGLHTRDNQRLIECLQELRTKGNTLVVVEHDEDTILQADHLIDMGPGAGIRGGEVIAQGTVAQVMKNRHSLTGRYLSKGITAPEQPLRPVLKDTPVLGIRGAALHNLNGVNIDIPLGRLVVITGVSGSGKSTLAREVLLDNMAAWVSHTQQPKSKAKTVFHWSGCDEITGASLIARVLEVDQTPIGKTPRSCPATYIGFWDKIRLLFADTVEARMRGFASNRFSFNAGPGRCPLCDGQGMQTIEMNFLPDVKVVCEACNGKRFNPDTLSVYWREKNIADILNMNVEDAIEFFAAHTSLAHPLQLLNDVGLGYLTLGQASPTLSGGEAQRIKLVTELAKVKPQRLRPAQVKAGATGAAQQTLYVLDEPTVGLHMSDVEKLITVLHRLVDGGHSVVTIEHDLDLIAQADWVIDMGPEGGAGGGRVVEQGPPRKLAKTAKSHTGRALRDFYTRRG